MSTELLTADATALKLWDDLQDDLARLRHIPDSTYRIQFNRTFTFRDAIAQLPYLRALGISHIYASPYFRARADSMHGYDICDHNSLNPSIGSEEDYAAFVKTLHEHGMGQILDVVPNHMGIGEPCNQYWMDVLENGPSSPYATFFDIDWHPIKQEMTNQVLLPILGAQYGDALENQELQLGYHEGAFYLHYYETQLPVAPRTYSPILEHVLELLLPESSPDDEHILELQSIITALGHLPPRTETDPERIAERQREKEVIKRRINLLAESTPAVAAAIAATVKRYNGVPGDARSFDRLDELVRAQTYRPAYWRVATEEINYRRFFDINDLAAIRMERTQVFRATHQLTLRLLTNGDINGLRVDHPDGLWDPAGYFRDIQRYTIVELAKRHYDGDEEEWPEIEQQLLHLYDTAHHKDPHSLQARPLYIVAEKILGHSEELPRDWTVDGTSGYDFLNLVNGLFVDSTNAKTFDAIYANFIRERITFNDLVLAKKRQIMLISLTSEINVLAHQLSRLAEINRSVRDFTLYSLTFALREVIACFPVYRTYITNGEVPPRAVQHIDAAINCAKRRARVTDPSVFDFIRNILLLKYPHTADEDARRAQQDWVHKFQQVTGPVMAKGLEDTAFYVYNRLISLNEVGGEPQRFGVSLNEFHRANSDRMKHWPHAMLASSTHDTKRSEDVRARINMLSELPREWKTALGRWSRLNRRYKTRVDGKQAPDRNEEYLLYQTLLGAWPFAAMDEQEHATFVERIQNYMQKALKEAKINTSWINPNQAWDEAVRQFVARILNDSPNNAFLQDFGPFAQLVAQYGAFNSLAQTLLKLTVPGVPDIYQRNELWDLSLVDPDNRRPVDYGRRDALLRDLDGQSDTAQEDLAATVQGLVRSYPDGCIKLYITSRTLRWRRDHHALFAEGTYTPLQAEGPHATNVVAFSRRDDTNQIVVVTPRLITQLVSGDELPLGKVWSDDLLVIQDAQLGDTYTNLFTQERVQTIKQSGAIGLPLAAVFANVPVALLVKQEP